MAHQFWFLSFLILLAGKCTKSQEIFECAVPADDDVCLLRGVKLSSPDKIYDVELPEAQQSVHFLEGNIPNFGEPIYGQLEETTNLTINKAGVEQLFVGPQLIHLNASWNKLKRIEKTPNAENLNLLVLELSHNLFDRVPNVKEFLGLQHLNLSFNQIGFVSLEIFTNLSQLQTLDLSNNRIRSLDSAFRLQKLKFLHLNNNHITDLDFNSWNLTNLKYLNIANNRMLFLEGSDFELSFPSLTTLSFSGNIWNCRALSKLYPHLQNRSISYQTDQLPCPTNRSSVYDICCDDSYVNFVTLKSQWDIRKLRKEMDFMNDMMKVKLIEVSQEQDAQIELLQRKLTEQEEKMDAMKNHLLQMSGMIEDLIEELYLRYQENGQTRSMLMTGNKIAF
ncbi:toll-like receptor Tollo [Uranotaenia lowii]|uniref:toll-like receptor Tollo n=1 Tax=Uranotaenia lowii TaxID=190385 RepID=UPI002479653D|nr:toll-like receptor Tollo [Uranotaenia lowii]